MLYPSIDDLMKKLDSKYTLVTVAARRARVLNEQGREEFEPYRSNKYVGVALEEILHDDIRYDNPYADEKK